MRLRERGGAASTALLVILLFLLLGIVLFISHVLAVLRGWGLP